MFDVSELPQYKKEIDDVAQNLLSMSEPQMPPKIQKFSKRLRLGFTYWKNIFICRSMIFVKYGLFAFLPTNMTRFVLDSFLLLSLGWNESKEFDAIMLKITRVIARKYLNDVLQ
jgi:hypothetical protein